MLPSLEDDKILFENFFKVLLENFQGFSFDGTVTWHIKHCYYEETVYEVRCGTSKLLFRVQSL